MRDPDADFTKKEEDKNQTGFLLVEEDGQERIYEENETEKQNVEKVEQDQLSKAINDIDLNLEPKITPSFYYYKRWLWIAFPWICLQPDRRYNYSTLIRECYSSNLKYLSVSDDMLLTECNYSLPKTRLRSSETRGRRRWHRHTLTRWSRKA